MSSSREAAGAGGPASPAEPVDVYAKAKTILSNSQAAVDALSSFMAARAQLEDTYAKALTKLAKTSLNVDESSLHPAVFEAIASLRGDVANEARQHADMFNSINKDVLEPLGSLKETADMVVRVVSLE
jgi:F-BAR domain only protein